MPRTPKLPSLCRPAAQALLLFSAAAASTVAWAQTTPVPSAGSLLEESRRQQTTPTLPAPVPPRVLDTPARPALELPSGTTVQVQNFRITGVRSFALAELQALVRPYTGRRLDLRALNEAAGAITRFYQSRGHVLTYAYLPAQRVDGDTVELAVLEGRIDTVQIVTAQEVRLRDEVVQAHTDALVTPGPPEAPTEPVLQSRVERQMLLLNDIPGVTARAAFTPGSSVGGADLVVSVAEDEPLVARIEYNNHGSASTGPHRAGLTLQFRNLFGWGDSTTLRGVTSNRGGLVTGSLSTQVPVGGDGWRMGGSLSRLKYQLGGTFAELAAVGRADTVGLDASYPLLRSTAHNLWLRAGLDHKRLSDELLALGSRNAKINNTFELGSSADWRDSGGGLTAASATATQGQLRRPDAATQDWRKLLVQAAHERPLLSSSWGQTRLYLRGAAQTSGTVLDSSEKLGLGGAGGVRAYAAGELSVDHGHLLSIELRQAVDLLGGSVVASLFHDRAGGQIDRLSPLPGNEPELSATGVGLSWNGSWGGSGIGLAATLAWRGSRVPTTDSADPKPRLFLQLQLTP